jgi:hypothetical protein
MVGCCENGSETLGNVEDGAHVVSSPAEPLWIECSLCRIIRIPEHLTGRHWLSPGKLEVIHSVIT